MDPEITSEVTIDDDPGSSFGCTRCGTEIHGMAVGVFGIGSFHPDCYDRGLTLWERVRAARMSLRRRLWWWLHGPRF